MRAGGIGKVVASRCEEVKVGMEVSFSASSAAYWVGPGRRGVAVGVGVGRVLTRFGDGGFS
jgi:hypothetical protein